MSIKKLLTFFGWPLLMLPSLVLLAGMAMNESVIYANGKRMPVVAYDCAARMQARAETLGHEDYNHFCATPDTKEKILADIFISNNGENSIGDEMQLYYEDGQKICFNLWAAMGIFCLIRKEKFYLE